MDKELTPLEALSPIQKYMLEHNLTTMEVCKRFKNHQIKDFTEFTWFVKIIETALKEKDKLEEMFNNDEELIKELDKKVMYQDEILRIIKDKRVAVDELIRCIKECGENALEEYNDFAGDKNSLTQVEFDLLKEWLK